ncbi:AAA family ATPase [Shewanella sp. 10N.286.52.B9]|uniref:AAA family ATPase n=1 Tax=Shewanella sp. 10N.286.52.B9 TaxID=1880837 RepID=UPI0018E44B05
MQDNGNKFYNASTGYYLPFSDLFLLRIIDDSDIFFNTRSKKLSISVVIADGDEEFNLKIKLVKPGIKNTYFRLFNNESFNDFVRFSNHIENKECSLKNAIFIYQTRPISTIIKNEPFYNNAQIDKKISIGKSHDVLRNKVLKTEDSSARVVNRFDNLETRLERVLQKRYSIRFKNRNRQDDEHVRVNVQPEDGKELDLSMMGSGFLQVVEIFSTLEYMRAHADGVCLILIDEPDSHIHSDLQSHLIDELRVHVESQIFLISHNDRLVNKADEGELYYLNSTVKQQGRMDALEIDNFPMVREGLASVLMSLEIGNELPIVITEGKTDQKILTTAWNKLNDAPIPFNIISSGIQIDEGSRTGSADSVRRAIEYISTLTDRIIIGLFDNDREGGEQFKGLNRGIFEDHDWNSNIRKHRTKNIFGLCLPVPANRAQFVVNGSPTQRYFVIEHYFSNEVLLNHNMKGESILGTEVFEISGNKNNFSDQCVELETVEFEHFNLLFSDIHNAIEVA